jgi:transketolase
MRKQVLKSITELAARDERVVFIGSDLSPGVMSEFRERYPSRFFMEGVSEQHIIGMAAGLAMEGFIPYVNTIATFLTRRCYEQIAMDVCLHNLPVRLVANGGGMVYAPLGPTHEAIDDFALMRALPNMTVTAPVDANEMAALVDASVEHPGPIYIRLGKGGDPIITSSNETFLFSRPRCLKQGKTTAVLATGVLSQYALQTCLKSDSLRNEIALWHCPTVSPLDLEKIQPFLGDYISLIIIEEHLAIGGLASSLLDTAVKIGMKLPKSTQAINLGSDYAHTYGTQTDYIYPLLEKLSFALASFREQSHSRT